MQTRICLVGFTQCCLPRGLTRTEHTAEAHYTSENHEKGSSAGRGGQRSGVQRAHGFPGTGKVAPLVHGLLSLCHRFSCHVFQVLVAVLCPTPPPTQKALLPPEPPASHLADSAGLSSHKAEEPRPERCEAAAAGEEIRHHTECLNPSSRGLVHLWERRGQKSSSEPMETTFNQFPHPHLSQEAGGPHLSRSC